MTTPVVEEMATVFPRQRIWKAYYAALAAVCVVKGLEALIAPDSLGAAMWLAPLTLAVVLLLSPLILAPIALLNTVVFVRPFAKMRSSHWRNPAIWAVWISYGATMLALLHRLMAPWGVLGECLGVLGLIALTACNYRFQLTPRPHRLFFGCIAVAAITPAFLLLRPTSHLGAETPLIWVTKEYPPLHPLTASPVYWQPNQCVYLQWKGANYRLEGMSPAFAFWNRQVVTLEGRDLVVTPIAGTPKRISLLPHIPNDQYILNMQPTRDGVLLNVYVPDYRVVRVNLQTDTVAPVPQALRVRGAESTDRYVVRWSRERTHQVRDGRDRVVRQHGCYPWRFREWDADPVDDLFAITDGRSVTLQGPDSITMSTIDPGIAIASITMQPGRRQIWIAESSGDRPTPIRLLFYSYNGRRLGQRTIIGAKVLRAMPVEESTAQYLIQKYASPTAR